MSARALLAENGPQVYLDLIHQFQPKAAIPVAVPTEEKPFTDDMMHDVCSALDVAAVPFEVLGVFFPPLKAVTMAVGIMKKIALQFSNQDKMAEFAKRINAKITALSTELDKGFDNLEEVITDVNFTAEVVSPTRELFAAFTRYAASQSEADKEEFFDCYDIHQIGGLDIIQAMAVKLAENGEKNLLMNVAKNHDYAQKTFVETVKYIVNSMYQLYTAHSFYLMHQYQSTEFDDQATRFMKIFQSIIDRLNVINEWKESAYWSVDFLKSRVEDRTKGEYLDKAAKTISNWLTNAYTWDSFLVVCWDDKYSKDDDSYYKLQKSDDGNTLEFTIFDDRSSWSDMGKFNLVIHRFRAKTLREPIDYGARKAVLDNIANRLENDRSNEFDVLQAAEIRKKLGFGFWSHFCGNNISLVGRKIWSVDYACSSSAKDEFFHLKTRTGDSGPFNRMRANVLIATY